MNTMEPIGTMETMGATGKKPVATGETGKKPVATGETGETGKKPTAKKPTAKKTKVKKESETKITLLTKKEVNKSIVSAITVKGIKPTELKGEDKSKALFSKVSSGLQNSILATRVISVNSILDLKERDWLIMREISKISNTATITVQSISSKVFKDYKRYHEVTSGLQSAKYFTLADIVPENAIFKSVFILSSLGIKLHLTVNKNGLLSIQKNDAYEPLLKASFFVTKEVTDEKTKEIKSTRETVYVKEGLVKILLEFLTSIDYASARLKYANDLRLLSKIDMLDSKVSKIKKINKAV